MCEFVCFYIYIFFTVYNFSVVGKKNVKRKKDAELGLISIKTNNRAMEEREMCRMLPPAVLVAADYMFVT